jgi:crotonobetainyl-CoA:carnitine CoA-transferase CaiB-like acyl-CoA transferase
MAALFTRERTGLGQQVSVSLLDTMMLDLQLEPAFYFLNSGERYRRGPGGRGNPVGAGVPYGVYKTRDERWLARCVEEAVLEFTAAEAGARLDRADVWNAPVYDYAQTFADPQVLHNGMLMEIDNPRGGTYRTTGIPVRLSRTPARPGRRPPRFAEHTGEILTWLGFSNEEIGDFVRLGIVATG